MPTSPSDKTVNPTRLSGLTQAIYVLKCLQEGMTEDELIERFQGDAQIVEIWKSFLIHNGWMEHPDGKWEITAKGKEWVEKRSEK